MIWGSQMQDSVRKIKYHGGVLDATGRVIINTIIEFTPSKKCQIAAVEDSLSLFLQSPCRSLDFYLYLF